MSIITVFFGRAAKIMVFIFNFQELIESMEAKGEIESLYNSTVLEKKRTSIFKNVS